MMNCGQCQEMISAYLDGELSFEQSEAISGHFSACADCSRLYEDFASIIGFCDDSLKEDTAPPNSQAMWCRINNIIETDIEEIKAAEMLEETETPQKGWFSGSFNLSMGQLAASVLSIALVSSLLTIVAFKNFSAPDDSLAGYQAEPSAFEKVLAKIGIVDSPAEKAQRRLSERKSAIDYWTNRVEKRRVEWDTDTRVTFDRNMDVIEKAVRQYTMLLKENPQDQISTEMLDSALNEKMELLREFSEL